MNEHRPWKNLPKRQSVDGETAETQLLKCETRRANLLKELGHLDERIRRLKTQMEINDDR